MPYLSQIEISVDICWIEFSGEFQVLYCLVILLRTRGDAADLVVRLSVLWILFDALFKSLQSLNGIFHITCI